MEGGREKGRGGGYEFSVERTLHLIAASSNDSNDSMIKTTAAPAEWTISASEIHRALQERAVVFNSMGLRFLLDLSTRRYG
jgi:hypothetical protein